MRKLALGVTVASLVLISVGPAVAIQNAIIQEVTFDDGPDLSNDPIKSLEMSADNPNDFWHMTFVGTAKRSSISDGRYGRGAQFDGSGHIQINELNHPDADEEPQPPNKFRLLLWVKPSLSGDQADGEIFRVHDHFAVVLVNGRIVILDEDSSPHTYQTNLLLSAAAFHHLWIEYGFLPQNKMKVEVDFSNSDEVLFGPMALWDEDTTGSMGLGFTGVLDELLVTTSNVSTKNLQFDRDPNNCPFGQCVEKYDSSLNVPVPGWPLTVPVRYKAVRDPLQCTTTPCPLLVMISGGGACGDDYSPESEVTAYAQRGFFVLTVDPNCEYGYPWLQFQHETSQLIAAKNHALNSGNGLAQWIQAGDYYATGCSHGAQAAALWLLAEQDHPRRAFARSANYAAHCTYHMATCQITWKSLDTVTCGAWNDPTPHDHNGPMPKQCIEEQWGVVNKVTKAVVQQRELGAIWGGYLGIPAPGTCCCPRGCVESVEGNDLGGRLMRTRWRQIEDAQPPTSPRTGWFWQWTSGGSCVHCPWDPDVERCSACFLKYGYFGMQSQQDCLDCHSMPEGQPLQDTCPETWGMPDGGLNEPCIDDPPVAIDCPCFPDGCQ